MRGSLISLLFILSCSVIGQKVIISLEAGPTVSFLSGNSPNLKYAVPINPATGYSYKIYDNFYKRSGNTKLGVNFGVKIEYKLTQGLFLMSGLSADFIRTRLTTELSSSIKYNSLSPEQSQLIIGESIQGYIPGNMYGEQIQSVGIDENGLPVVLPIDSYEVYKIQEEFSTIYISIPVIFGIPVSGKWDLSIGGLNSFLVSSDVKTKYPYYDDRILENNISIISKYLFSVIGRVGFHFTEDLSMILSYQRSMGKIISLNARYNAASRNKINTINLGLNYSLKRKGKSNTALQVYN